jgi:hypothetical protein
MRYAFGADLIVALHVLYVGFIIVGQFAILTGWLLRWDWVRNLWFRLGHLAAILVVALEAGLDIDCPLTVWEQDLRSRAGQDVSGQSFIGRCLHNLIFYDADAWVLNLGHVAFAGLVLGTLFLVPPRWRKARKDAPGVLPCSQATADSAAGQR